MNLPRYEKYKDSSIEWLGKIPEHWDIKKLKYVANLVNGSTPSSSIPSYWDGEIVWVTPNDLGKLKDKFIYNSERKITQQGLNSCGTKISPKNSIILSSRAPIGHVGITGIDSCINQGCKTVVPCHKKINAIFLYYFLIVSKKALESLGKGTTFQELSKNELASYTIPLPEISEQKRIAEFLDLKCGEIDEAIAKKQRLIELLEEQKTILINQAVTKGLNPDAPMKDSGIDWLGEIPEHWEVWRSKHLFRQSKELARSNDIQLSATQAYGVIPQEEYENRIGRKVTKVFQHLEKRRHVEIGDFVISMRSFQGGLERAWAKGCIRSSYVVLKPSDKTDLDFFMYLFKSHSYIKALQTTANFIRDGQDLNFDNFCGVDLPLPPIEEQRTIAKLIRLSIEKSSQAAKYIQQEIEKLTELKQILIAEAVTGKIKV